MHWSNQLFHIAIVDVFGEDSHRIHTKLQIYLLITSCIPFLCKNFYPITLSSVMTIRLRESIVCFHENFVAILCQLIFR